MKMNKTLGFALVFFSVFILPSASTANCANLSYISPLGAGEMRVLQVGCEKWQRQGYFKGQPYGDVQELIFSADFSETKVDDQHEKFTNKQRWFWSSTNQEVLIHEFVIDGFDKSTGIATFSAGSESFSLDGEMIKVLGQTQTRTTAKDGSVTFESTPVSRTFNRLK